MWRLQGFFSRVLHRCHGNAPLRLSQNHCVEDEVVNGSNLLSNSLNTTDSSSQREKDGGKGRKQKTSRFCHTELPRYTALDAVGWGAAAALLMQICRRLHSQWSSGPEAGPGPATGPGAWASPEALHKCGYRVLLEILSKPDAFPRAGGGLCMHILPEGQGQAQPQLHNFNSSSRSSSRSSRSSEDLVHFSIDSLRSDHQRADLGHDGSRQEPQSPSSSAHLEQDLPVFNGTQTPGDDGPEVLSGGEGLMEAASTLGHVGHSSVPVVLNIIGLDSAQTQRHQQAFPCFAAAARRGYSQAQYNAAVCWETGRGVAQDTEQALHYYWLAAAGGHAQAQYRYAKLLLTSRRQPDPHEWSAAVRLLELSAASGLTEAQVFLGSVFSQEAVVDGRKAVHYLKMAAKSGDGRALLHLGRCYDRGFGVRQSSALATGFYERAARAGNSQAQGLLRLRREDEAALRSIRSSPCFFGVSRLHLHHHQQQQQQQLVSPRITSTIAAHPHLAAGLTHSWSTGSLASTTSQPLHLHLLPQGGGGPCRWTLGV
ncbi:unnamed protein product [Gadus morhua 'NCC']